MHWNQRCRVQICHRNFTACIPSFHSKYCLGLTTLSYVTLELDIPAATDNDQCPKYRSTD